jgi:hypothetical protein
MTTKLLEVYECKGAHMGAHAPFQKRFQTREVYVNPDHVVCLREDQLFLRMLQENNDPLTAHQTFTRVFINRGQNGIDLVVIGEPSQIEETLNNSSKQLLKG